MTIEELKQSVHEAALTRPRMVLLPVSDARKLLKVVEAAHTLQIINTAIESRLSDELEDIERDVNSQEDAEAALRKALEELGR